MYKCGFIFVNKLGSGDYMSIISFWSSKSLNKKRDILCEDTKIFVQVHFVREKSLEKYNLLKLKSDPQREECIKWYEEHNNPSNFQEIVSYYLKERKIKKEYICKEYNLVSSVFNIVPQGSNIINKWEAIAICFGLDLNISQARILLNTLNYSLSNSSETDLVIRYCFENDIYEADDINYILTKLYNLKLEQL